MLENERLHRTLKKIHAGARRRALRSGIDFALAPDHVEYLWRRQGGCCAVSGISFNDERFDHALVKHPYAPSLDRIDSRAGYTPENVRLVCTCANFRHGSVGRRSLAPGRRWHVQEGGFATRAEGLRKAAARARSTRQAASL
jgi:hypothetical protein